MNGSVPETEECETLLMEAARIWKNTHKRNLPPLNLPRIGGSNHSDIRVRQSATVAIETEEPSMCY